MSAFSRLDDRLANDPGKSGTIEILRCEARALVAEFGELHDIILELGENQEEPADPDPYSPRNVLHYAVDVLTDSCGWTRAARWLTQIHPVFGDRSPLDVLRDEESLPQLIAVRSFARRYAHETEMKRARSI